MDFKVEFMGRCTKINEFLRKSASKSPAMASSMPNQIHFCDLLDEGRKLFRELTESKKWGAAVQTPSPEHALLNTVNQLVAQVAQLDQ